MSDVERIDWIVFADDWGRLPSTTQHLIRHLPESDRVIWIDGRWSSALRSPARSHPISSGRSLVMR